MNKEFLKRLERLEALVSPSLTMLCSMPDGTQKILTANEYVQQPEPLDFKVSAGGSYLDAAVISAYVITSYFNGAKPPMIDPNGCEAMTHQKEILDAITRPVQTRNIEDFQ